MRFFIALEIPEQSKKQILSIQEELKTLIPNIRLTDENKLHLTIAFVGEQDENLKNDLIKILTQSTKSISSFAVTPAYIDGFPNLHHARILWLGIKGDIDKLHIIRERIKDGLSDLKLETDERRYIPHIAIGKINQLKLSKTLEEKIQAMMLTSFNPIIVTSIKLFESIPNEGFHHHNTLAEITLG